MLGKADIAQQVAQRTGLPRVQATKVVDALADVVRSALARGEEVRITGFGSWRVSETKARKGRNPRTGEPIEIKAGRRVSFSPGSKLVESVRTGSAGDGATGRAAGRTSPARGSRGGRRGRR
ncbi:MAG TPA: HU family DNA-binding protein [Chloroflexota bacterium]|nr:HU family DNA-binding protein [Chloroflexota bacterium]